jgi:hypothetical protein
MASTIDRRCWNGPVPVGFGVGGLVKPLRAAYDPQRI